MHMTSVQFAAFKREWNKITKLLKNVGYDLSKIKIVETRE